MNLRIWCLSSIIQRAMILLVSEFQIEMRGTEESSSRGRRCDSLAAKDATPSLTDLLLVSFVGVARGSEHNVESIDPFANRLHFWLDMHTL